MLQMNEAYQEVYETIQHFEPELYKRIPEKFIRFLDFARRAGGDLLLPALRAEIRKSRRGMGTPGGGLFHAVIDA